MTADDIAQIVALLAMAALQLRDGNANERATASVIERKLADIARGSYHVEP